MFCAYCGIDHDESVRFSSEHVVPYAIGGSHAFTIRVCVDSNTSLGGKVDRPFIEFWPVASARFFLGLVGTDGTEPVLDLGGTSCIDGRDLKLTYTTRGDATELRVRGPQVVKHSTPEGEHYSILGDPEAVKGILKGQLVKGKTIKTDVGELLTVGDLDDFVASRVKKQASPSIAKMIVLDPGVIARFFAKLALATGHYVLGESFSRSPRADTLRVAMNSGSGTDVSISGAHIWPFIEGAEGPLRVFRKKDAHTLAVLYDDPPIFVASIFGGIDALIPLGEPRSLHRVRQIGRILEIELPSRNFMTRSLEEYASMMVQHNSGGEPI